MVNNCLVSENFMTVVVSEDSVLVGNRFTFHIFFLTVVASVNSVVVIIVLVVRKFLAVVVPLDSILVGNCSIF